MGGISVSTRQFDALTVHTFDTADAMAQAAAREAHGYLQRVLKEHGAARIIFASAASQVRFLEILTALPELAWSRVTLFHMDEYLGVTDEHSASFGRFLREHVVVKVRPAACHYLRGDALEPIAECERYGALLGKAPVDLCCLGIGENGHVAFNDPPVANFEDPRTVKLVKLDEACRLQQVGEGAFPSFEAVPQYALTLTVPALCAARRMICVVPDTRKARAVHDALLGPIQVQCPASILRRQAHAVLYLDAAAAARLGEP